MKLWPAGIMVAAAAGAPGIIAAAAAECISAGFGASEYCRPDDITALQSHQQRRCIYHTLYPLHNQPTCTCYFSSINPLDPSGQVARTYRHLPTLSSEFDRHPFGYCATSVRLSIHPISQQFWVIQISFKNPSVCLSLISTVLLPPSDHPRLRFKPCAWPLCTLSSVCSLYVCM